jgi:hypothetical protein
MRPAPARWAAIITDWREANRANWDERVEVLLKAHDLGSPRALGAPAVDPQTGAFTAG